MRPSLQVSLLSFIGSVGSPDLPLGILFFQGLALVIVLLTPRQTNLNLGVAVLEIKANRDEGVAGLFRLPS